MRFEPPKLFTANDAAPPPGQNRLLSLPRELRDMIYNYALTEDQGLILVEHGEPGDNPRSFKGYRPTDPGVESNRLKYVCRQLYHETKGLGLALNDIAFGSERQLRAFFTFLTTSSVGQRQSIRKVILRSDDELPSTGRGAWRYPVLILSSYVASYPRMNFHLYMSCYDEEDVVMWVYGAVNVFYAKHRHTNYPLVSEHIRQMIKKDPDHLGSYRIPSRIRVFSGAGPGHFVSPKLPENFAWGESRIKISLEGIEKWHRDGI